MKNLLMKAWKGPQVLWLVLGMVMIHLAVSGQEARYQALRFEGNPQLLNTSFKLPPHYYRNTTPIVIQPRSNQRCTLEIKASSIVESVKFILKSGAELRVYGAMLRRCQIIAEAGSEVVIESSALEACEFGSVVKTTQSPPSLKITNSVILGGGWMTAANQLGLEMIDSVVKEQISNSYALRLVMGGENTPVHLARRPRIRYTRFENCSIHPSLLLTISQVTVDGCKYHFPPNGILFGSAANTTPEEVLLPIRWINNQTETPPTIGSGVGIQRILEPISGGCTLVVKVDDGTLDMDGLVTTPLELLKDILPAPVEEKDSLAEAASMTNAPPAEVKLQQAHVNGLLVMPLATGKEAGLVTKMNITVVPGTSSIRFSQYVGEDMAKALKEVQKFARIRHQHLPTEVDMEISFEEKYSEKDGPSAAVACALLLESVLTGRTWDPSFAVTGDMNADGSVQPIGGVAAKLRGATRGSCKIVGIPIKNEKAISDLFVVEGPGPIAAIHVFALDHFDQAVSLASPERPVSLQQAVNEFEIIRGVLQRDPRQMTTILRSPQAMARLQAVLEKAPNSLSAKYLLLYAQGRSPTTLSMGGSLETADMNALGLVSSIENDFKGNVGTLKPDELGGTLNRLRNLRPRLDSRVWPYVDALVDYGEIVRSEVLNPARNYAKFNEMAIRARQAAGIAISAKKSLMADPQVLEDLGL